MFWVYWQIKGWRKDRWVRVGHTYDSEFKAILACKVLRSRGLNATHVIHSGKPNVPDNCGRTCVS